MSRTRLSLIAAGLLVVTAATVFMTRQLVLAQADRDPSADLTPAQNLVLGASFSHLPSEEQQFVRFLLLLPVAAVVVSVFRVVIGIPTYGMFAPALLGLIFRDLRALPWGLGTFVLTVMVGWGLRRGLDRFHLLLIPRAGALLTLIVIFLSAVVVAAHRFGVTVTGYVALFPLIILTHLVERFWTIEAEDGTAASFRTLLGTVIVVAAVSLVLSPDILGRWLFRHPEALLVVVAAQLLLGRYTGYRLTELYRFRDVIEFESAPHAGLCGGGDGSEDRSTLTSSHANAKPREGRRREVSA
jgi:7 transmembrane helices usually fused to an inactive transglutaminase